MKLLVLNPNTTAAMTDKVVAEVQRLAGSGVTIFDSVLAAWRVGITALFINLKGCSAVLSTEPYLRRAAEAAANPPTIT